MKNDVEKYIAKRKRRDKAFAMGFKAGYALTARTANDSKADRHVKRFGSKKAFYAD